jgi:hypothetical protein
MKIKQFAEDLFVYCKPELNKQEEKKIKKDGLEKFILGKITSAKYRRKSIPEFEKENILRKIEYFVKNEQPIKITPCFGGYKQK